MSHVVWSVCVSVCVLVTRTYCAKVDEPVEMLLGGLTHVGPRNHVLGGSQDQTNPFETARGDKSAMRSFDNIL